MRVVVVGAGLGGLSAACHLAGRGHDVTVVERETRPGGRAGLIEREGYRIDTGPTVFTMPDLLRQVFAAAGADMDDHLRLVPLDPMYRATFPDDGPIHVRPGRDAMAEEIRNTCGAKDADAFIRFCDWLARLYKVELPHFIDKNFDSPLDLARPLKPALDLVRLGAFRKVANVVAGYFDDHRLQKLFSFQSLYAGLSPFDALAVYCVITYMDTVEGVWFPEGGMHAIATGLAAAAEKAGATFRYDEAVERVERHAVVLQGGERIDADAVVCNPDLPVAYRELLRQRPPRKARTGEYSPSCALWLAGARGSLPDHAAHHNIHFGRDWRGSFEALLTRGSVQPDPSILVSVPTRTDPSLAPPGAHVLYALEPVPNLDGNVDWAAQRAPFKAGLQRRLADLGYPAAPDLDVDEFVDPLDWQRQGMERGTPFALSHRFSQTGPFRPKNVHDGVVFVGSGTVPGVSVPMVLLSGRLAAERVEQLPAR